MLGEHPPAVHEEGGAAEPAEAPPAAPGDDRPAHCPHGQARPGKEGR